MIFLKEKQNYHKLLTDMGHTIAAARQNAFNAINFKLGKANWEIIRDIVVFEQLVNKRDKYGSALLARRSKYLKLQFGKGFGSRNFLDMQWYYLCLQKWQAVPAKLSWTQIITILPIKDDIPRKFCEMQGVCESWRYRQLGRKIVFSLFERLAFGKVKSIIDAK